MDKAQSKFHNTAAKMNNALFWLLEEKSFYDITIKEVCERAGVNRSTFYAHYQNTYELLEETQNNLINEFFNSFNMHDMDIEKLSAGDAVFIDTPYLVPFLEYVKKNKSVFKVYLNNLNYFKPSEVYNFMLEKVFIAVFKKYNVTDKKVITYMMKYFLTGVNAIVEEWLAGDCKDDINFVCKMIITCVMPVR